MSVRTYLRETHVSLGSRLSVRNSKWLSALRHSKDLRWRNVCNSHLLVIALSTYRPHHTSQAVLRGRIFPTTLHEMSALVSRSVYEGEPYKVVHIPNNTSSENEAPISLSIHLTFTEIMNGKLERIHNADQVNVDDMHARFRWDGGWIYNVDLPSDNHRRAFRI